MSQTGSARRPSAFSWCIACFLVVLLAACTGEENNETAAQLENPPPKIGRIDDTAAPRSEPVRNDIRIIAREEVPTARIRGTDVERLPPEKTASEINSQELARLPVKPLSFARPLVEAAGVFSSGGKVVTLTGIDAPGADETCESENGLWPCGRMARAALRRLVRTRTINCESANGAEEANGSNDPELRCHLGNVDLSQWLVERGWARATSNAYNAAETNARSKGRGLWRE